MFTIALLLSVWGLFVFSESPKANGANQSDSQAVKLRAPATTGKPQEKPTGISAKVEGAVSVANLASAEEQAKKVEEESKGVVQKFRTEILSSPKELINLGTLVTTGLAAGFAFAAYRAARRQANAAERHLKHITSVMLHIDGVRAENFGPGNQPFFFIKIINSGSVPADKVSMLIRLEPTAEFPGAKYTEGPHVFTIPGNSHREEFIRAQEPLTADLIAALNANRWQLRITGHFTYEGKRTEYCYRYNPGRDPRPAGLPQFIPCDWNIQRTAIVVVGTASES